MAHSHTATLKLAQIEATRRGWRLHINTIYRGWTGDLVRQWPTRQGLMVELRRAAFRVFGLGTGTLDLVGWRPLVITADMVGRTIAQASEGLREEGLPPEIFKLAVKTFWKRTWGDLQARIVKWEGWEKPKGNRGREDVGEKKISAMEEADLKLMLVKLAIAGDVEVQQWSGNKAENLKAAAKVYGVDVKAVEKQARAEIAVKKVQAKGKAKKEVA